MKIEKGMKVFITGAASGIGRSTAIEMAKRGCRLYLTDLNETMLEETVELCKQAGGEIAMSEKMDVSSLEQMKSYAERAQQDGPMDIIMNIAGIALYALIENMDHSHWERIINVNLWGPIHALECFTPKMIEAKRGHILTVSSMSGLVGFPVHAAYAASKYGLVGISEVLRYDLMRHNIQVTVVCPGAVATPLVNTVTILGVDKDSPKLKAFKARFEGHGVTPEKVAGQIVHAIEHKKFLVITSFDVKLLYFVKRYFFPAYNMAMKKFNSMVDQVMSF